MPELVAVGVFQKFNHLLSEWIFVVVFLTSDETDIAAVLIARRARMAIDFRDRWFHPEMIYAALCKIFLARTVSGKNIRAFPKRDSPDKSLALRDTEKLVEMRRYGFDSFILAPFQEL